VLSVRSAQRATHYLRRDGTSSMATHARSVVGGVDTHKDTHVVAAVSDLGALLGTAAFPTTSAGYAQLLNWLRSFGSVSIIGIEGSGSYGAGLCRFLHAAGVVVREVPRPKQQWRYRHGKSDPRDAEAAARAVLAGEALGTPQHQDGVVEAIRLLRLARRSALKGSGNDSCIFDPLAGV